MRIAGGRRIAIGTITAGVVISLGALFAARGAILEQWYIHRLRTGDYQIQSGAIHKLREMRAVRAVPTLLEAADQPWISFDADEIKISSQAWVALKEIAPGESLLLARFCDGSLGERRAALRLLADVATERSIPILEEIAARDGNLGPEAALLLTRLFPTLTIQGIEETEGRWVAHLHLVNYTPRQLQYFSNRRLVPLIGFQHRVGGAWIDVEDAAALVQTRFLVRDLAPRCGVSFRVPIVESPEEFRVWTSFSTGPLSFGEYRVFSPAFQGDQS